MNSTTNRSAPGLCAARIAVICGLAVGEPPVLVGQAVGGVLPGLVVGAWVGVAVGAVVVGATVAVRAGVEGAVVGAAVVGAADGEGVRRTVSGPQAATTAKVSANSALARR